MSITQLGAVTPDYSSSGNLTPFSATCTCLANFRRKGNLNFQIQKYDCERKKRKSHFRKTCNCM